MKSLKILVVDDDEFIRGLVGEFLMILNHQVFLAKDGEEAIEKINDFKNELDLVITDLNMPQKKGNEVIKFIKTFYPKIKTILMSGDEEDLKVFARESGADDILLKPIKFEEVKQIIRKHFYST